MALTQDKKPDPKDTDKPVDEEKANEKPVRKADNLTNTDLVTLVWYTLGSPCGTVDEWIATAEKNGDVWQ